MRREAPVGQGCRTIERRKLRGHVAIERCQSGVRANRDFAASFGVGAVEARRDSPSRRAGCEGVAGGSPPVGGRPARLHAQEPCRFWAGCAVLDRVASGVTMASALRRNTTGPLPSAAGWTRIVESAVKVWRPPTTATSGGRSRESEPEQLTASGRAILALHYRIFHPEDAPRSKAVHRRPGRCRGPGRPGGKDRA